MTPISSLQHVNLVDIELSSTNKIFRTDNDFADSSFKELMKSIEQKGVIAPVLLRAAGKKFILVAGERRFRACQSLKLESIPSYIREMSQEEAFELQLTENLQRKDVHPLKEAQAFHHLSNPQLNGGKMYTTAELALRFGKSESYILQRLKLTSLIEEAAKEFAQNKLLLGHALLLARLTPADQVLVLKESQMGTKDNRHYYSVNDMEEHIQDHVIRELKEAPFNPDDAKLVPKAGACSVCPKRSGASPLLFSDIKEKDRCFDSTCFTEKCAQSLAMTVRELVEKKPDTIFLESVYGSKIHPAVGSFLASQHIKPLKENTDWEDYDYRKGKKITGFMINGNKSGKTVTVYSMKEKSSPADKKGKAGEEKVDAKEAIARIKERTARAAELDEEKVYMKIIGAIDPESILDDKTKPIKPPTGTATKAEMGMIRYQIIRQCYEVMEKFEDKIIGKKTDLDDKKLAKLFIDMDEATFIKAVREIIATDNRWRGQATNVHNVEGQLFIEVARSWGAPIDKFEKEQADIKDKREARAKERIKDLTDELKVSSPKAKKK